MLHPSSLDINAFGNPYNHSKVIWLILAFAAILFFLTFICIAIFKRYGENLSRFFKKPKVVFISVLLLAISVIFIVVFSSTFDNKKDGFEFFEQKDGTYKLISYSGNDAHVIIPSTFKGKLVTAVGTNSFKGGHQIKSIIVPATVTEIEWAAFKGCTAIESITLPTIGRLTYIFSPQSLTEQKVPDSLREVVLLDTCTHINSFAFQNCPYISDIYIPSSVLVIESYDTSMPFSECSENLIIHCQKESKPQHWSEHWNYRNKTEKVHVCWDCNDY